MKEAAKMTILNDAEETVQNTVHHPDENTCKSVNEKNNPPHITPDSCNTLQPFATSCNSGQDTSEWAVQDLNL
ncbi:MAG: hypothetical protein JXA82_18070 [Sedimentisphaerales bacterium]|nr:hypothetical protein [Sedimentisphaerales bacterium]